MIDGSTVPAGVLDAAVAWPVITPCTCTAAAAVSALRPSSLLWARLEGMPIDRALELAKQRRPIFAPLPWQVSGLHSWSGGQAAVAGT